MKTISIISDTHGTLNPRVLACVYGCDHIFHAGDIGDSSILDELKEISPVTAIMGNNDDGFLIRGLSRTIVTEEIEGVAFAIVHRPNQLSRDLPNVCAYYARKGQQQPKIVGIHGHLHVPKIKTEIEAKPADLIVCPGSVSLPREGWEPTYANMEVEDGKILSCEIRNLSDEVLLKRKLARLP